MFGWLKKGSRPVKAPVLPIEDPDLGHLTPDESFWIARSNFEGKAIEVSLAGTAEGPDDTGRQIAIRALASLASHKQWALSYILSHLSEKERSHGPFNFSVTGICVGATWQNTQSSFTLTLQLQGDEFSIWRVEIGPNGPIDFGCDR